MPSPTLQLLQGDLLRLPKELEELKLAEVLRSLYERFQLAITSLEDAVGDEVRPKRIPVSTLCESILAAIGTVHQTGIDSAVALLSPGLDAVRADLLGVACGN